MSLRDFNSADDRIIPLQHEPLGNADGLGSFHTVNPENLEPSNTPKIVGALAVALMIGVAGISLYAHSGSSMQIKPVVTASNVPATAPVQQAAISPDANMPASAPVTPPPSAEATKQATKAAKTATADPNSLRAAQVQTPAKSASTTRSHPATDGGSAASDRMAADSSQSNAQPQQQQAVINPPTPSPSDVATTNTQSSVAVPQGATTASDVPAPAAQPDAPSATPAQPAAQ